MYGRNVFQILQKKAYPTKNKFSYGTIDRVKHALVENGPVFIALPLYNNHPAFWKSNSGDSDQAHDFQQQFLLRDMIPTP